VPSELCDPEESAQQKAACGQKMSTLCFVLQDFSWRISFRAAEISSELCEVEGKITQQGLRHSGSFKTSVCITSELSEGPESCSGKKFSLLKIPVER